MPTTRTDFSIVSADAVDFGESEDFSPQPASARIESESAAATAVRREMKFIIGKPEKEKRQEAEKFLAEQIYAKA